MNKEIKQICQKINYQDILNKKFYPVWFFTNERINKFFSHLENKKIGRVFSVGGGGDFAFSILSSRALNIEEINICDIRQMANVSIDFKIALFKNLEYQEILDLFLKRKFFNKNQIYERIKETITPISRKIFDFIVEDCRENDFLKCLKKSGFWYKDSFWQVKNRSEYLLYLTSEEKYNELRKNLDKISIYCGDFKENLELFPADYYDLIYTSNILDSKRYCREPNLYLQTIKNKLKKDGFLFVTIQNNWKKTKKLIEKKEFLLCQKEIHRFNIISEILGHYSFSFLLFKN
jgi:hypothetical protein